MWGHIVAHNTRTAPVDDDDGGGRGGVLRASIHERLLRFAFKHYTRIPTATRNAELIALLRTLRMRDICVKQAAIPTATQRRVIVKFITRKCVLACLKFVCALRVSHQKSTSTSMSRTKHENELALGCCRCIG